MRIRSRVSGRRREGGERRKKERKEEGRGRTVLEDRSVGDLDSVALVSNDDDGPSEGDVLSKDDVSVDRHVVGLENVRDRLEPLLEVGHLLERVSELDNRRGGEESRGVHDQRSLLKVVKVRLDEQQVRARLNGKESRSGDVDALGSLEVLDSGSDGGLELDDGPAVVGHLVVDDDLHRELSGLDDSLDGLDVDPHWRKERRQRWRGGQ